MNKLFLSFILISLFSCNQDFDEPFIKALLDGESPKLNSLQTIAKKDKLYNYLDLISKKEGLADIGCIEFFYPFVLFQFDDNDKYIDQVSVSGNENFATILDNLEDGFSIGLSYPISGNLIDGTPVTVGSNEELQKSLETCIEEELEIIIGSCNAIIEDCIWKVTESDNEDSPYIDSYFTMRTDGSVAFSILQELDESQEEDENQEETEYDVEIGTWIFYFIGADLHMNINFGPIEKDENAEVVDHQNTKLDWNFDWKINYIDSDKILIEKTYTTMTVLDDENMEQILTEKITLEKECEQEDMEENTGS